MPGIIISRNGERLAAVSTEGLNILTAQVVGDVLGPELSVINVFGGLYGEGEADKHLIWLDDFRIDEGDVVRIEFVESTENSHQGKTIEELHPDSGHESKEQESIEELFNDLLSQKKIRNGFSFKLISQDLKFCEAVENNVYSFICGAIWRWIRPEQLKVYLASNTLEKIKNREDGINHGELRLKFGQFADFEIGGI